MKKLLFLFIILINSIIVYAQDTTNVLFIGNSITYFNNMPQTFEDMANDRGDATSVTVYAPGGTGFINHVNDPNVYNKFRQGIWDFVVLQPGSNESPGYSETREQTLMRLKILKDSIMKYNPCAKILLYEISYGVWGNTAANLMTYNNTMDLIRSNCEYWADSTQIFFAPAGESIRTAWNNDSSNMLWVGTGNVHPNAKGSYIIACSLYAAIYQKNSTGTSVISSLTQSEASEYQQLADSIVLNHLSDWRINTYYQFTDFTYDINEQTVSFNSISQNIDSLIWHFGDNTTSVTPITNHTYGQAGAYTVLLTTYKETCIETVSKEININATGTQVILAPFSPLVYPNPFTNRLYIKVTDTGSIENIRIYNLMGQDCTNLVLINANNSNIEINTSKLPGGGYIIMANEFAAKVYK